MAAKLGCHGNDSVDEHVMTTLIYSLIILVKVAKFGCHSLYGFKVIQLFKEGGLGQNRVKITKQQLYWLYVQYKTINITKMKQSKIKN